MKLKSSGEMALDGLEKTAVFSERERHVRYMLSPVRLSSVVCRL